MPAIRRQIIIEQGATLSFGFQVLDSSGEPRDLTGYTAAMQVRASHSAATPLLSLSSSAGITINPSEGRVSVKASPTQTASLPAPAALVYDIEGTKQSEGLVERWVEGVARVMPEVTR